ncbi:MAG: hypothetical protein ACR2PH_00850 [Desulfobulbia bacterium]
MDFEIWKELFLSAYEGDEIVELLDITAEEICCAFPEKLIDYYKELEVGGSVDE